MAEIEKDPRLQLYPAARDCLERLHTAYTHLPDSTIVPWVDYAKIKERHQKVIAFEDPASVYRTKRARLTSVFQLNEADGSIALDVFAYRTHSAKNIYQQSPNSHLMILAAEETPPLLLDWGIYDRLDQTLYDVRALHRNAVAEPLGRERAEKLCGVLETINLSVIELPR